MVERGKMGISCALTWTTIHKGCSSTDHGRSAEAPFSDGHHRTNDKRIRLCVRGKLGVTTHENAATGHRLCPGDGLHLSSIRYGLARLSEGRVETWALRL